MPEGDTVHTLAGYLREKLVGRTPDAITLREGSAVDLAERGITSVEAIGKHLLIGLESNGGTKSEHLIRSHLGMQGGWYRYNTGEAWKYPKTHASLIITIGREDFVLFHAEELEVMPHGGLRHRDLLAHLGPDLCTSDVDFELVIARARRRPPDTPILDVLLDQRVASGIGNVYKSEVLFVERCEPRAPLADLPDTTLRRLYETASRLLRNNLSGGPRITRPLPSDRGQRRDRLRGAGPQRNDERLWVYGRDDRPCHECGAGIVTARLGHHHRSTYWCPRCQPRLEPPTHAKRSSAPAD